MNESIIALDNFIADFALKQPDGIVYFYANIQFLVNNNMQLVSSDVHIVTSDRLATIYILGIEKIEMPDMFTAKNDVFIYIINEYLRIEGEGKAGRYNVSISPKKRETF